MRGKEYIRRPEKPIAITYDDLEDTGGAGAAGFVAGMRLKTPESKGLVAIELDVEGLNKILERIGFKIGRGILDLDDGRRILSAVDSEGRIRANFVEDPKKGLCMPDTEDDLLMNFF